VKLVNIIAARQPGDDVMLDTTHAWCCVTLLSLWQFGSP
jgi:hypothetical protein